MNYAFETIRNNKKVIRIATIIDRDKKYIYFNLCDTNRMHKMLIKRFFKKAH